MGSEGEEERKDRRENKIHGVTKKRKSMGADWGKGGRLAGIGRDERE